MRAGRLARRSAAMAAVSVFLLVGSVPASADNGVGVEVGVGDFCVDPPPDGGDLSCGKHAEVGKFTNLDQRGVVLTWSCAAAVADANALALTITRCYAQSDGNVVKEGLRNGTNVPASATAGGSTDLDDEGVWEICQEGEILYIAGSRTFGPFCSTVHLGPF